MCEHALSWWAAVGIIGCVGLSVLFGLGYLIGADRPCCPRPRSVQRQDGDPEAEW